jgi:hypothetical protein
MKSTLTVLCLKHRIYHMLFKLFFMYVILLLPTMTHAIITKHQNILLIFNIRTVGAFVYLIEATCIVC